MLLVPRVLAEKVAHVAGARAQRRRDFFTFERKKCYRPSGFRVRHSASARDRKPGTGGGFFLGRFSNLWTCLMFNVILILYIFTAVLHWNAKQKQMSPVCVVLLPLFFLWMVVRLTKQQKIWRKVERSSQRYLFIFVITTKKVNYKQWIWIIINYMKTDIQLFSSLFHQIFIVLQASIWEIMKHWNTFVQ